VQIKDPELKCADRTIRCKCGKVLTGMTCDELASHLMTCPHLPNRHRIRRHDHVRNTLLRFLRHARLITTFEVTERHQRKGKKARTRPDITIHGRDKTFVDVAVVNPTAKSFLAKYHGAARAAAVATEKTKSDRYQSLLTDRPGSSFVPFVVETFGTMGPQAAQLVERVVTRYQMRHGDTAGKLFRRRFLTALSVSLQKDNAHVLASALDEVTQRVGE
jgi:hypothetical protein